MFKHKKSEASSIGLIVAAVIGLIIIVVIVMMLSGKIGAFSKGVDSASSCDTTCKASGMDGKFDSIANAAACLASKPGFDSKYLPGKFPDIPEENVCCCKRAVPS